MLIDFKATLTPNTLIPNTLIPNIKILNILITSHKDYQLQIYKDVSTLYNETKDDFMILQVCWSGLSVVKMEFSQ